MSKILVVGIPRSGTTWVAHTLARAPGVSYIHEPDNDEYDPFAKIGTAGLGHYTRIASGQRAPRYELLWDIAFRTGFPRRWTGGVTDWLVAHVPSSARSVIVTEVARAAVRRRPRGQHQLVKTVRAPLSIEWIAARHQPSVVVLQRNPLNVVASWRDLRWQADGLDGDAGTQAFLAPHGLWPPPPAPSTANVAWAVCALSVQLAEAVSRHPNWRVVSHTSLCRDPEGGFRELFAHLGLVWTSAVGAWLAESNRPGSTWEPRRVASEQPEAWRRRLTSDQVRDAVEIIERFRPLDRLGWLHWTPDEAEAKLASRCGVAPKVSDDQTAAG